MLSATLSRFFFWLFLLSLIFSAIDIFIQISQQPVKFKTGKDSNFSFGLPGIQAEARRIVSQEKMAPDTVVSYTITNADSSSISKSEARLNADAFSDDKSFLSKMIATETSKGNTIKLDTHYYSIKEQAWYPFVNEGYMESGGYENLPDGRIVYTKKRFDKNKKLVSPMLSDTLASMREANIFSITNTSKTNYIISQLGALKETLRLQPVTTAQRILFVCYDIAYLGFISVLLYMLYKLFKNFAVRDYFSFTNVKLLRNTGICLLLIQLVKFLFYVFCLSSIHPVKINITGDQVRMEAQYELYSGIEFLKIFLGLGIIILSYIFLNGLRLKEEQSLTV